MLRVLPAVLLSWSAACGPDPALQQAEHTTRVAANALSEVQVARTSGGEDPGSGELGDALERAEDRLSDAEQTMDLWQETGAGRLGWETIAPCLAAALADVEAGLEASGRPVSAELRQARTMAESASERTCGRR